MKGKILSLPMALIIGMLLALVLMGWLNPLSSFDTKSSTPTISDSFAYDYSPYLPNDEHFEKFVDITSEDSDSRFCDDLRRCVRNSVISGGLCEMGSYSFGDDYSLGYDVSFSCDSEDLYLPISSNIKQKVCKFDATSINTDPDKSGVALLSSGYSDKNGMFYRECVMGNFDPAYISDGGFNVYYSSDRLTSLRFFSSFTSNLEHGEVDSGVMSNELYLTPSNVKFAVQGGKVDLSTQEDYCQFNLVMCPSPILSDEEGNKIFNLFNYIRRLPIQNFTEYDTPYYVYTQEPNDETEIYKYNKYVLDINEDYDITTVLNAVKFGFAENPSIESIVYTDSAVPTGGIGSGYGGPGCADWGIIHNCPDGYECEKNAYWKLDVMQVSVVEAGRCCLPEYDYSSSDDKCYRPRSQEVWDAQHWTIYEYDAQNVDNCWDLSLQNDFFDDDGSSDERIIFYDDGGDGVCEDEIVVNFEVKREFPDKDYPDKDVFISAIVAVCCD